ncbi:MAG: DUF4143 domain-containing protein, partial [Propionibacteriaceae bacterium]|nr:DUF4143 domain-containing protein [Propionibacteriaceae bacterium]
HNRVTRRLLIQPFTLGEARELAAANGLPVDTASVVESYMILGGIPYYLSLLSPKLSLAQNIGRLCFEAGGVLRNEFENLYLSLFKGAERHLLVVRALGRRLAGLTREEIIQAAKLPQSGSLSSVLNELETSGFIRSYTPYGRKRKGTLYQLVDHFTLFHLAFIERSQTSDSSYWLKASQTQAYRTWRGYAFEQICLAHLDQIRQALGIQGVIADVSAWRSYEVDPGAQIDLVLDRADRVVSLCEMKYSESALTITKALSQSLRQKRDAFLEETGTRKGVQVVLITPEGVKRGSHDDAVSAVVTALDLMK